MFRIIKFLELNVLEFIFILQFCTSNVFLCSNQKSVGLVRGPCQCLSLNCARRSILFSKDPNGDFKASHYRWNIKEVTHHLRFTSLYIGKGSSRFFVRKLPMCYLDLVPVGSRVMAQKVQLPDDNTAEGFTLGDIEFYLFNKYQSCFRQ